MTSDELAALTPAQLDAYVTSAAFLKACLEKEVADYQAIVDLRVQLLHDITEATSQGLRLIAEQKRTELTMSDRTLAEQSVRLAWFCATYHDRMTFTELPVV